MVSKLVMVSVEKLQGKINNVLRDLASNRGIYVSLNKNHSQIEEILIKNGINTKKLFFIDCITEGKEEKDVVHVSPADINKLKFAIRSFIKCIPGKKFLLLDALSTLIIYNHEEKVAQFVKEITELAAEKEVEIIAFSPKTKGEELLNKIFNFFDKVIR